MINVLPRDPESTFKSTPTKFSKESGIENLLTYEDRSGIILDNLNDVKEAINIYVTQIRSVYEKEQNSKKLISMTCKDLQRTVKSLNVETMASRKDLLSHLNTEINSLPNLTMDMRERINLNFSEYIGLFEKCECIYEGEITNLSLPQVENSLLVSGEIIVNATHHKYILSIRKQRPDKKGDFDWFEQELANTLRKERLIYQTGIQATFNEVDGAWYNIPLFDLVKISGLKYVEGRDILTCPLKNIGVKKCKILGEDVDTLTNELNLCFPHKKNKYGVSFKIDNLHSSALPTEIEINDEIDFDERRLYRYAKLRGNNLVGPAWTLYRDGMHAEVEKPVLNISLSYPNRHDLDVPIIDCSAISNLIEARNYLLKNIGSYTTDKSNKSK